MLRKDQPRIITAILAGFGLFVAGSSLSVPSRAQPQEDGKTLFAKRCGGCHALDRDKEGPRLGGVYGRTAGSVDSFEYSDALKKSQIVWTDETLERWLTDTEKLVPNNNMTFHVEKPDERLAIIAFLKRASGK
jgi:cytochrome c